MENVLDDEESELDILDEAVTDIATTRVKYFKKCKNILEKMSDLEDSIMTSQLSRQTELNNHVEVIDVPDVKLPSLNHFSVQCMEQYENWATKVRELNEILEVMDRRIAAKNSVNLSAPNQSNASNPNEADPV